MDFFFVLLFMLGSFIEGQVETRLSEKKVAYLTFELNYVSIMYPLSGEGQRDLVR